MTTTTTNSNGQTCFLALPSTLSIPLPSGLSNALVYFLIAVLAAVILFVVINRCTKKRLSFTFPTVMSFLLLFALLYIIISTMGNNLVSISVPSVINSGPSHLGLDGVSKDNHYAGKRM